MALAQQPDIAVLETARGGMLLRGSGVRHNDVAVVTNVSADHLGLHGVDTVDQLAEVKAIVTRITRPSGWDVLNADDPRVLAMRRHATGRLWLCSLHPDQPALREAQHRGGRAMTVLDGAITWFEDHVAHPLLAVEDVPITLAGISRTNTQNALAAAAAALAVGLPERGVIRGPPHLRPGPRAEPRPREPVPAGRSDRRDRLRPQRGRDAGADRGARRAADGRATTSGSRSARPATGPTRSCTASPCARRSDPTTWRWRTSCATCGAATATTSSRSSAPGASEAGVDDVPEYEDELHALRGMLRESRPRRRRGRHRPRHAARDLRLARGGRGHPARAGGREADRAPGARLARIGPGARSFGPPRRRGPLCDAGPANAEGPVSAGTNGRAHVGRRHARSRHPRLFALGGITTATILPFFSPLLQS